MCSEFTASSSIFVPSIASLAIFGLVTFPSCIAVVSTALLASSLAPTASAAICVEVTVLLTNLEPVIVAFAISPSIIFD